MTYPVDGGTSKPMTSLLLLIFCDCITAFCTAGHVLTEEQSEEYYTAVTSDCRRARRSSALGGSLSSPLESLPGGGWISCHGVILNVKDGTADCDPTGNVRHGLSNAKALVKDYVFLTTDCNESSDGKLNPAENQLISHCILTLKWGKQCDGQTKAIWGASIFYSCGVSLSAPADSVFLSQMTLHDGCKMRQRV